MNDQVLKIVFLCVFFIETVVFGLLPIWLVKKLRKDGSSGFSERASFILSLLSSFAGGVFLGVCFLDMLPDSLESWEKVQQDTSYTSDYPFVPLIFCLGFFLVYILEELSGKLCGHSHGQNEDCDEEKDMERIRAATYLSSSSRHILSLGQEVPQSNDNNYVSSITFVSALLVHVTLEGFAFGVQSDVVSITSLFFGICVHKALVIFSVGTRISEQHPNKTWFIVSLIMVLAIAAPLGGAIGIIIETSQISETPKDVITCVLMSLSLGTFIYVTFFEILAPEHANKHSNLAQWLSTFIGFLIIAGLMSFGG
ncbi:unnamed protein product [Auanema sp. JU1783]|nr:unnamed protein product [Auanema sp. JU1783]